MRLRAPLAQTRLCMLFNGHLPRWILLLVFDSRDQYRSVSFRKTSAACVTMPGLRTALHPAMGRKYCQCRPIRSRKEKASCAFTLSFPTSRHVADVVAPGHGVLAPGNTVATSWGKGDATGNLKRRGWLCRKIGRAAMVEEFRRRYQSREHQPAQRCPVRGESTVTPAQSKWRDLFLARLRNRRSRKDWRAT